MIVTTVSHDIETGKARLRFEHNGVTYEDNFDLIAVVPGTKYVLEQMGLTFDEAMQQKAIDRLTTTVQAQIESGMLRNPLPSTPPVLILPDEATDGSAE